MRSAADLLALAEEHALSSAKAHMRADKAEDKGLFGDAFSIRTEAQALATTSLAFSQLAEARAIYTASEPDWLLLRDPSGVAP